MFSSNFPCLRISSIITDSHPAAAALSLLHADFMTREERRNNQTLAPWRRMGGWTTLARLSLSVSSGEFLPGAVKVTASRAAINQSAQKLSRWEEQRWKVGARGSSRSCVLRGSKLLSKLKDQHSLVLLTCTTQLPRGTSKTTLCYKFTLLSETNANMSTEMI